MSDDLGRHTIECDWCYGTGKLSWQRCPHCKGKGYLVEDIDEEKEEYYG